MIFRNIVLITILLLSFVHTSKATDYVDESQIDQVRHYIEAKIQGTMFLEMYSHIGNHFNIIPSQEIFKLERSIEQRQKNLYELGIALHSYQGQLNPSNDPDILQKKASYEIKERELNEKKAQLEYFLRIEQDALPTNKTVGRPPFFDEIYHTKKAMKDLFMSVLFAHDIQIRRRPDGKKFFIAGTAHDGHRYIFVVEEKRLTGELTIITGHPEQDKTIHNYMWDYND